MSEEGLRFLDDDAVAIGYVTDLYALLRAIDETMPEGAILYVEGTSIAPEIRDLLSRRAAPAMREIARGRSGGRRRRSTFRSRVQTLPSYEHSLNVTRNRK